VAATAGTLGKPSIIITLEDTLLFSIFNYLDTPDVLSLAIINKQLFARIDIMFGIGSSVNTPKKPSVDDVDATATAAATAAVAAQKSSVTQSSVTPVKGTSIFSKGFATLTSTIAKTNTAQSQPSSVTATDDEYNGGFAMSIVDKLTAVELKSIISLTDKLKSKESSLKNAMLEIEDVKAKLEGVENVKVFFMEKIDLLEKESEGWKGKELGLLEQINSDNEVIGFVDARVRELESSNEELARRCDEAEKRAEKVSGDKMKQMKVLEDMLQFERISFKNSEASHKTTKKALVREVKGCRANVENLVRENAALREEVERLNGSAAGMAPGSRRSSLGAN
jgi:hypothetical protein